LSSGGFGESFGLESLSDLFHGSPVDGGPVDGGGDGGDRGENSVSEGSVVVHGSRNKDLFAF